MANNSFDWPNSPNRFQRYTTARAEAVNGALDQVSTGFDFVETLLARSIKVPSSESSVGLLPALGVRANNLMSFDANGQPTVTRPGDLATVIAYGSVSTNIFTADGTTTTFLLSEEAGSQNNLQITLSGVMQVPGVDYTYTSTPSPRVVFVQPPPRLTKIFARFNKALYQGYGDSSQILYTGSFSTAVPRATEERLRDKISVLDYIKPDGTTDDIPKINALIQKVYDQGGGIIHFPWISVGYTMRSQLKVLSGVYLQGGWGLTEVSKYTRAPFWNVYYGKNDLTSIAFLMQASTGMAGFAYVYPEQVGRAGTDAVPTVFGWLIGTDLSLGTNLDSIYLENLLLINPYLGINLDKAGRFYLRNIHGQPLKKGIFIDRVYDVPRMENIHFWPFWYALDSNIGVWCTQNLRQIECNRVDGMNAFGILTLGGQQGLWLSQTSAANGFGPAWATFTGCNFDGCTLPIGIEKVQNVQFFGGSGTTLNAGYPIVHAFGDIQGTVNFVGFKFYGLSNMALVNSSSTGIIVTSGCIWPPYTSNGVQGVAAVNESTGILHINGELGGNIVFGGVTTFINGVALPPQINQITPALNPSAIGSWSGSLAKTQVTNGVKFGVTSALNISDYNLGTDLSAPGIYAIEMELLTPANSGMYVRIHLCGNTGDGSWAEVYFSFVGAQNYDFVALDGSNRTKIIFPYFGGQYIEQAVLRVEAHTYAAGVTSELTVQNIKFYMPDTAIIADATAQLVQSNLFAQPVYSKNVPRNRFSSIRLTAVGGAVSPDGVAIGNRILRGIKEAYPPSVGLCRRGDIMEITNAVPGGVAEGYCITEGIGNASAWRASKTLPA